VAAGAARLAWVGTRWCPTVCECSDQGRRYLGAIGGPAAGLQDENLGADLLSKG
jgi:hypothetical protein